VSGVAGIERIIGGVSVLKNLRMNQLGFSSVVCVSQLARHVGDLGVMVHHVGSFHPCTTVPLLSKLSICTLGSLYFVGVFLYVGHGVHFPVVKGFEVSARRQDGAWLSVSSWG